MNSWMKKTIVILAVLASAQTLFAKGPGSGNGGTGVMINGKPYLLDLVEAGVEKNPYFSKTTEIHPVIQNRVAAVMPKQPELQIPVDLIAAKISEINEVNRSYARLFLKVMELYQWRFVNQQLIDINDQKTVLDIADGDYIQLAVRAGSTIKIDAQAWLKMDASNRVALVMHEIIYAWALPTRNNNGSYTQDITAVQELTGSLFSEGEETFGLKAMYLPPLKKVEPKIPTCWGNPCYLDRLDAISYGIEAPKKIQVTISAGAKNILKQTEFHVDSLRFLNPLEEAQKFCQGLTKSGSTVSTVLYLESLSSVQLGTYTGQDGKTYSYAQVTNSKPKDARWTIQMNGSPYPCEKNVHQALESMTKYFPKNYSTSDSK